MVRPYLNEVGGKVDDDVSLFSGGLNTYQDKAFLEANQMPYVMNMTMWKPPMMCTRPSRISMGHYMADQKWAENIGSVIDMWAYDENQFYVIVEGSLKNILKMVYKNSVTGKYAVTTLDQIEKEPQYYFTLCRTDTNNYLYITGLTFKEKVTITTSNPLSTSAEPVEDGHYGICCYHKGRLFLAEPENNRVAVSALNDFDNFDEVTQYVYAPGATSAADLANANTDYIYLMDNDDTSYSQWQYDEQYDQWDELSDKLPKADVWIDPETNMSIPDYSVIAGQMSIVNARGKMVAMVSFDDKLLFMSEHSIQLLYGSTPDQSKSNQFQLVDFNNNLGCHSSRCVAVGAGRLFFLGDDYEVYEYTGASLNIVSRPGKTRNSTLAIGGISNIFSAEMDVDFLHKAQMTATADKLYFNIGLTNNQFLFVFDAYNRLWWCEDGEFTSIANYSTHLNQILMAKPNGDILRNYEKWNHDGVDMIYDFTADKLVDVPIEYEFHTRVYGADGTDTRKSITSVWFQARATAKVYINDIWTSHDKWEQLLGDEQARPDIDTNYRLLGNLHFRQQDIEENTPSQVYRPEKYEQQPLYVEKLFGQRLNTFQFIVKGTGEARFYLMKREWRAR